MGIQTAEAIIRATFPDFRAERFLLDGVTFPKVEYVPVPVDYYTVGNPKEFDTSGSCVWVPKRSMGNLKRRLDFKVEAHSPRCTFVILRTTTSGRQSYILKGPDCRVLSMSATAMSFTVRLCGTSSFIIGEGTYIASARLVLMDTDISIGADGLWSDEILIQGSDQHGIIDLATGDVLNGKRKHITIGRHVWIGRRATITKNVTIGDGSIIGTGSIVTKSVAEAVAVGGVPAKVLRKGVTWINDPVEASERESADIARLRANLADRAGSE